MQGHIPAEHGRNKQTWMSVKRWVPFHWAHCELHMANTRVVSQTISLLFFLSFFGEEEYTWSPWPFTERYEQTSLASPLQQHAILPWLEWHREGKAGFSVSLDNRGWGCWIGSHYVSPVKEEWTVSFASYNQFNCIVFCAYVKMVSLYLTRLIYQCLLEDGYPSTP